MSPLTESIADFDSFPRGQDFELSMFVVLALLCLVLLAALWARRLVEEAFGDRIWEPHEFWETPLSLLSYLVGGSEVWIPPKPALSLGVFALPLRI